MGSITYDFLKNSFLLNLDAIESRFSSYSDKQIWVELNRYREYCLENYEVIAKEILDNRSELKLFCGNAKLTFNTIKQLALYVDQCIIDDPIFGLSQETTNSSSVMSDYLGYNKSELDRRKLIEAAKIFNAYTPMVASNYVKFFPITNLENKSESIPVNYSENNFSELLPKSILEFYYQNIKVNSLKKESEGWSVEEKLNISRGIIVGFRNHNFNDEQIYHLFENEYLPTEIENEYKVKFNLPDSLPSAEMFNNWVVQSINKTSKSHFDKLHYQSVMSAKLEANYLTSSVFNSTLLKQTFNFKENRTTSTTNELMNLELPFLSNISTEDLMSVRLNESDSFETFRLELEKKLKYLKGEPENYSRRKEDIIHELYNVNIHEINRKMKALRKKTLIDSIILTGGLSGAILTSGWSLLASGMALSRSYKNYSDYLDNIKSNPSFFLWKTLKEKKASR